MKKNGWTFLIFFLTVLLVWLSSSTAGASTDVFDFLIMDVCVDANDRPVAGVPGKCAKHRNLHPGERIPYFVANYPESGDRRCFARTGYSRRYNFEISSVRRGALHYPLVLSVIDHGGREGALYSGCSRLGPQRDVIFGRWDREYDGLSVISGDDRYLNIMASKSQNKTSYFMGERCGEFRLSGIERFAHSWVITSTDIPAKGVWGFGLFHSKLSVNKVLPPPECRQLRTSFIAWTRTDFGFGPDGDFRLETIVSDKYANAGNENPGDARQVERSYWTREFGITRWEKWERVDHERRDGQGVIDQAHRIFEKHVCGSPYGPAAQPSPTVRYQPVEVEGLYRRNMVQIDKSGHQSRSIWYLVACSDWTNSGEVEPFDPVVIWNQNSIPEILKVIH